MVRTPEGREIANRPVDAEGIARFEDLPIGESSVSASAPGHAATEPLTWTTGSGDTGALLFELPPGTSLEGRVVEAAGGAPVAGALADVRGEGELGNVYQSGGLESYGPTRTDADGRFRTAALPFDRIVTLVVSARGYRRAEVPMRLVRGVDAREPVLVALEPGGAVRGSVSRPDGSPAVGATVYAVPEGDDRMRRHPDWGFSDRRPLQAKTDARGEFVLDGLALGASWCATATADGFARAEDACGLVPTRAHSELVAALRLRAPAAVVLRVRDPEDRPVVVKRVVHIFDAGRSESLDETGTVRFEFLDPGSHTVDLTLPGFVSQRVPFDLAEGERLERTVRLARGVAIAGTLLDDQGRPVADADVKAGRKGVPRWPIGQASTDAEGRFRIEGLEPGEHSLDAYGNGIHVRRVDGIAAPSDGVRLVANRLAKVHARVRVPEGSAPPGVISDGYRNEEGVVSGTKSWGDGAVTWLVPAGPLQLTIQAEGFAPWERAIDAMPGEETDLGEVVLDVGADVEGRVVDSSGGQVVGAAVSVQDHDHVVARTDAEGRFRLRHVARAKVFVEVEAGEFLRRVVAVDASRSVDPLTVVLARGGTVAGTLRDAKGVAISSAYVSVFQPDSEDDDENRYGSVQADLTGVYRVRVLQGRYRVEVEREDAIVVTGEVTVEEGKETRLDLTTR